MYSHNDNEKREQAKNFLQLILRPPVEQLALLSDDIRGWKANNQIAVITKAEEILQNRKLNTRKVSLKVLHDLLNLASLEEEDSLQDKWAVLMANTIVESSGINTTLYSHLLGQLSKQDADVLHFVNQISTESIKKADTPHKLAIMVAKNVMMKPEDICKIYKDSYESIDNLIRLRLIKEVTNVRADPPYIMLTDLGFRFMTSVTIWD